MSSRGARLLDSAHVVVGSAEAGIDAYFYSDVSDVASRRASIKSGANSGPGCAAREVPLV